MEITQQIQQAWGNITCPITGTSIPKPQSIDCPNESISIKLKLPFFCENPDQYQQLIISQLSTQTGLDPKNIHLSTETHIKRFQIANNSEAHPQIKNIIAVASGKGGVGKSMISTQLALHLQSLGARVGLLDADIYGPSQPHMLGSYEAPTAVDKKSIRPVIRHGLQTMSIGYLLDMDSAVIWRGPMVSTALWQLYNDTQWEDLDYLIVDLPPGTGDIQLTLAKKMPINAAVVVTTPQDLALLDVRRAMAMFNKVKVPILGLVENMSHFTCPHCGHDSHIFAKEGAQSMIDTNTPLLAQIPLDPILRACADAGTPLLLKKPHHSLNQAFNKMATAVGIQLAQLKPDYSHKFKTIKVESK